MAHMQRFQEKLQKLVVSFHHAESRDQTPVSVEVKCPYPLSLSSRFSERFFLKIEGGKQKEKKKKTPDIVIWPPHVHT